MLFKKGDKVEVAKRIIEKGDFPERFKTGFVVEVEFFNLGGSSKNSYGQNLKVKHGNGIWGWANSEVVKVEETDSSLSKQRNS